MTVTTIGRRGALALIGGGATVALPGITRAQTARDARFAHGIASGDPAANGAVIWTRATPVNGDGDVALDWHVAASATGKPIASGQTIATASADHTAKVEVAGLKPGRDYWFWFASPTGTRSPVGRFRTLPVGRVDRLVLAVASCQLYPGGFFNAYADMAALPRLDAVLHLGDYIYEYSDTEYGSDIGRRIGRLPEPPHETVTLADYRRRHAQVKADPQMQAAHARAAFICVWDDHEIANDTWVGGAENHTPGTEGDWATRKAAAMQAYFEWMPIRDSRRTLGRDAICRAFEFGDLASLAMVDTRVLARSEQVVPKGVTPADVAAALAQRAQPDRELLGPAQQAWLEGVLAASVKAGKPWQVIGNQVVMARVAGPDLERFWGKSRWDATLAGMSDASRKRVIDGRAGYRAGLPFNLDAWDGYPPARERLYAAFRRAASTPIVLAGDSHAAWTNELFDDAGTRVATEFGATAITSPSYGAVLPGIGAALAEANREVLFCDQDHKGYTLLTLTPQSATAEHVAVSTVTDRSFTRRVLATHRVRSGRSAVETVEGPAEGRSNAYPA